MPIAVPCPCAPWQATHPELVKARLPFAMLAAEASADFAAGDCARAREEESSSATAIASTVRLRMGFSLTIVNGAASAHPRARDCRPSRLQSRDEVRPPDHSDR